MLNQKRIVDIQKIETFYQKYTHLHGTTNGWPSLDIAEDVYLGASNCSSQKWVQFKSVLDVGSGEGHFLPFLRKHRGFTGQYTGLELLNSSHQQAIELYGYQNQVNFLQGEFLSYSFANGEKFDWVFSLGSLGIRQESPEQHDWDFCQKMLELARFGISIYLNDQDNTYIERTPEFPEIVYHDAAKFTAMLKQICPRLKVEVSHYPTPNTKDTILTVHGIL
ncbi:MAG: class I SAM-dependent methyltransferase [Crocosphaera sp.]|nr:class I SAM-dependent methyltransferase [Crocosphaera sp.]